jgi:hypothetical protein
MMTGLDQTVNVPITRIHVGPHIEQLTYLHVAVNTMKKAEKYEKPFVVCEIFGTGQLTLLQ